MSYLSNAINNINPVTPCVELGVHSKKGGAITLDQRLPNPFTKIMVTTAGNVSIVAIDGTTYIAPALQPGTEYYMVGFGVTTAGTAATGIYWFGGD